MAVVCSERSVFLHGVPGKGKHHWWFAGRSTQAQTNHQGLCHVMSDGLSIMHGSPPEVYAIFYNACKKTVVCGSKLRAEDLGPHPCVCCVNRGAHRSDIPCPRTVPLRRSTGGSNPEKASSGEQYQGADMSTDFDDHMTFLEEGAPKINLLLSPLAVNLRRQTSTGTATRQAISSEPMRTNQGNTVGSE